MVIEDEDYHIPHLSILFSSSDSRGLHGLPNGFIPILTQASPTTRDYQAGLEINEFRKQSKIIYWNNANWVIITLNHTFIINLRLNTVRVSYIQRKYG